MADSHRSDRIPLPAGTARCSPGGTCSRRGTCARWLAALPKGSPMIGGDLPAAWGCGYFISIEDARRMNTPTAAKREIKEPPKGLR